MAGKPTPRRLSSSGTMINSGEPRAGLFEPMRNNREDGISEIERRRRITLPVVDHSETIAHLSEAEDRSDEVVAEGAVKPCGAQNDVTRVLGADTVFAGKLGLAINT